MTLDAGQPLPDFDLPTDGGGRLAKADLQGAPFVLYLYPKDDTSGCTKEALAFQDLGPAFAAIGVKVVGLSKDGVKSHDKFKTKYGLDFPLLSDEAGGFVEALGAWVEKSMYGRKYMGVERTKLLIDRGGRIARIWNKVKVRDHASEVLQAARELAT